MKKTNKYTEKKAKNRIIKSLLTFATSRITLQQGATPHLKYTYSSDRPHSPPSFSLKNTSTVIQDGQNLLILNKEGGNFTLPLSSPETTSYITTPKTDIIYLKQGNQAQLLGGSQEIGLLISGGEFVFGELFGGDINGGSIAIVSSGDQKIKGIYGSNSEEKFRKVLDNKGCTWVKDEVVLCLINYNLLYIEPGISDEYYQLDFNFTILGQTVESYRTDLVINCGFSADFSNLECEIWNITNSQFYDKWSTKHDKMSLGETYKKESELIQIYPDQFLVSSIAKNNSIVFYSSRDGSYQFEIENFEKPTGITYNKFNSIMTYLSGDNAYAYLIEGTKNKKIENCLVQIPEKEICLKCSSGLHTSSNRSACWEEIPNNWFSYTWGHGSGSFLVVKFKFGEATFKDLDIKPEEFVRRIGVNNVWMEYEGKVNPEKYFTLSDISSDFDARKLSKRFHITYHRDISQGPITLKFIYPQFRNSVETCPFFSIFNLKAFETNTYFPTTKIPSFWVKNEELINEQYIKGFRIMSLFIFLLKYFVILVVPFIQGKEKRKKLFWITGNIWMLQGVSLLGLLGTNFRGLLGLFLDQAINSVIRVWNIDLRINMTSDVRRLGDDVFLGKFSYNSKGEDNYQLNGLIFYQMLFKIIIYLILMIASLTTTRKTKRIVIGMRVGFALTHLFEFIIFSTLSIKIFFYSSLRSHWLIWLSFIFGFILLFFSCMEIFGVYFHREDELLRLERSKYLMNSILSAVRRSRNKGKDSEETFKKSMFSWVERDFIGFDLVGLKQASEKKKEEKIIQREDEYYEFNENQEKLNPVKVSLVKKIADPEIDEMSINLTFRVIFAWFLFSLLIALIPSWSLFQSLITFILFLTVFISLLKNASYIESFNNVKRVLIIISYGVLVAFSFLIFVLAFDNLSPFIGISGLRSLTNFFIAFYFLFWIIQVAIIGTRFREIREIDEEVVAKSEEEVEKLVKDSAHQRNILSNLTDTTSNKNTRIVEGNFSRVGLSNRGDKSGRLSSRLSGRLGGPISSRMSRRGGPVSARDIEEMEKQLEIMKKQFIKEEIEREKIERLDDDYEDGEEMKEIERGDFEMGVFKKITVEDVNEERSVFE